MVAGLIWRPLGTDPRGETRAAARMLGTRYGMLVQTSDNGLLCGFLPALAPAKARNAFSGAIWLANAVKKPTLFIKNLANGEFWTVATTAGNLEVRSDQILPEDQTKQLVDQLLAENLGGADADKRFHLVIDGTRLPASAMIERFEATYASFDDLVGGVIPDKNERVTQLVGIKPSQVLAVAAVIPIALAAYFGWKAFDDLRAKAAFEAQRAELEHERVISEQLQNEAQIRMAQAVVAAMRDDTATPAPAEVMGHCRQAVRSLSLNLGGWRLTRVGCAVNGSGVDLSYVLDALDAGGYGTNGSLIYAVKERYGLTPNIAFADGQATLHIAQDTVPARTGLTPVQAPHYADVLNGFVSHFQLAAQAYSGLHYKLDAPSPRAATYVDPAMEKSNGPQRFKQVPADRSYREGGMSVYGQGLWLFDEITMQWPFVTIKSIDLTPSGTDSDAFSWKITGIYVTARS
jgi:hypothetical protein